MTLTIFQDLDQFDIELILFTTISLPQSMGSIEIDADLEESAVSIGDETTAYTIMHPEEWIVENGVEDIFMHSPDFDNSVDLALTGSQSLFLSFFFES